MSLAPAGVAVPYVIAAPCIDVMDKAWHEGQEEFVLDNARFFELALPGREEPIGAPGGALGLGPVGADTEFVAGYRQSA
jgi:hypothetical protein